MVCYFDLELFLRVFCRFDDMFTTLRKRQVSTPIPDATTDHQAICENEPARISDSSYTVVLSKKQKKRQAKEAERRRKEERKQKRQMVGFIDVNRLLLDDEESIRPASVLSEKSRTSEIRSINSEWTLSDDFLAELEYEIGR